MLTRDEYTPRLAELGKIKVQLQADPVVDGIQGITSLLSTIQGHKERVTTLYTEAIWNRAEVDVLLKDARFKYERKMDELLATDADIRGQKTVEMRKATANNKLTEELLAVHHAEMDYVMADAYYKAVGQVHGKLESAKENLSRQISAIQLGIGVGDISREDLGSFGTKEKTITLEK